jgi:hypothetical protein
MKMWFARFGLAAMIGVGALSPTHASAAWGNQGVYVFDAYWCPYCKLVKDLLLWPPNDRTRSGSCVSCDELTG